MLQLAASPRLSPRLRPSTPASRRARAAAVGAPQSRPPAAPRQQQPQQQREADPETQAQARGDRHRSGLVRKRVTLASLLAAARLVDPTEPPGWHQQQQPTWFLQQQREQQQDQQRAAEEGQPWHGPDARYGAPVRSRAELQAVVLQHWEHTAGERLPGTDHEEALQLEGLADVGMVSRAGRDHDAWKLVNQDSHLVAPLPSLQALAAAADEAGPYAAGPLAASAAGGAPGGVLLGCFDGHGFMGAAASRFTRQRVASGVLQQQWRRLPGAGRDGSGGGGGGDGGADVSQSILHAAFESAGAEVAASGMNLAESGSTAVVCLVEPGRVTAAWCGDSRAVLGLHVPGAPGGGAARVVHPLTEDHRPQRPLERARIEAAGGQVRQLGTDRQGRPTGPFRLCGPNLFLSPRPMVSRAFGDTNAAQWGLSYLPDVVSVEFPLPAGATDGGASSTAGAGAGGPGAAARHVLILGTDGLWDTISAVDACVLACSCSTALEAARALTDAALRRWAVETAGIRCDDITVVVAFLPA